MPTDIPTAKARLLDQRTAVVAELAAIDLADEQAKIAAAETILAAARTQFEKAQKRYRFVEDAQGRLAQLDDMIALFTP